MTYLIEKENTKTHYVDKMSVLVTNLNDNFLKTLFEFQILKG